MVPDGRSDGQKLALMFEGADSVLGRAKKNYWYTYSQGQEASAPASKLPDEVDENHSPTVILSYSPSNPTERDLIEFTAEASDPDGDELTDSWFIDDEEQADTGSTMSTTLSPGDHTVIVKVSDGKGGTDEDHLHLTVTLSSGITGNVIEAVLLLPITDATVTVENSEGNIIRRVSVDGDGKYSVLLPPGTYRVWASAPGYLPSTGMSGEHVEVEPGILEEDVNFRLVMEPTNGGKTSGAEPILSGGASGSEFGTKSFEFAAWGTYRFADISGKRYFAAYLVNTTQEMLDAGESAPYLWLKSDNWDLLKNGQLSEVLIDNRKEVVITSNNPLKLKDGYELAIKSIDIEGIKVYLELSKDDAVVDSKVISPLEAGATMADRTYYYKSDVGRAKKMVQIAVYFKNTFKGIDQDLANIGGVFQISESPLDSATTQTGAASISGPNTAIDWVSKGNAFRKQGKHDEAIKAYDEAIRLDPNDADAWYNKGEALNYMGESKYDEAIKAYDEAIRLDPQLAEAWFWKGNLLNAQGKHDEALEAYDEAIRLDPNDADAWVGKGVALNAVGDNTEAENAFAKALELGYTG